MWLCGPRLGQDGVVGGMVLFKIIKVKKYGLSLLPSSNMANHFTHHSISYKN
uniref:Uncharacterized protein n=1 Tax=Solanum tuberosum TaxID=4113 RepID=M1CRX5_SOLTU